MYESKMKILTAQTKALEYLQGEREKLNKMIEELKQEYRNAKDPLKKDIELQAEQLLIKLNDILLKLKTL